MRLKNVNIFCVLVYDDVENEGGSNKMMVGSMNGASKFTKKDGEEEQLGGTIYTKNLRLGMKMPEKIVEGRNNWLLMEKDPSYEDEDMGESCMSNFDHCNEMASINMPRDILAKLTRYFIRDSESELSFFQEAQREASEIMSSRRPHWRKRKAKSASLFLSIFFLIEKEVSESIDENVKKLFVEAFDSRDRYIDSLMEHLNRVDEIEASMTVGKPMKLPGWTCEDDVPSEVEIETTGDETVDDDVDKIVMDTLDIVEDMDEVEISKYVKVFQKGDISLAVQHTKVKTLAKQKNQPVPKFKSQKKSYPPFVTLKTETFTRMSAENNTGAENTKAGFCTSFIIAKLYEETQDRIKLMFGLGDDALLVEGDGDEDDLEMDPTASQDYPMYSQSQSAETLKVCNICNFSTRSKLDFQNHLVNHHRCQLCKKDFPTEAALTMHMQSHKTIACNVRQSKVQENNLKNHMESHNMSENYRKGLSKSKKDKNSKGTASNAGPRLNSYHIFCRAFREEKQKEFPQLNMLAINAMLREEWHKLTKDEKAAYKPAGQSTAEPTSASSTTSSSSNSIANQSVTTSLIQKCNSCDRMFLDLASLQEHTIVAHAQNRIHKCGVCGRMFVDHANLEEHKKKEHTVPLTPARAARQEQAVAEQDSSLNAEQDDEPEDKLYFYNIKKILWPCKSVGNSGELVKIEVFNDGKVALEVDVSKLKPFQPLASIPRSRTAEWRRGYERALQIFMDA